MLAAGYKEEDLIQAEFPQLLSEEYDWFLDLRRSRKTNEFSLMPIEFTEMESYFSMRKINIEKWQIDVISILDSLSLEAHREKK